MVGIFFQRNLISLQCLIILKKYLSYFFLALLLFPVLEKTNHELAHLKEKHCSTQGLHFCNIENTCEVCDYVFSNSNTPPTQQNHLNVILIQTQYQYSNFSSNEIKSTQYTLSLRGPPAC